MIFPVYGSWAFAEGVKMLCSTLHPIFIYKYFISFLYISMILGFSHEGKSTISWMFLVRFVEASNWANVTSGLFLYIPLVLELMTCDNRLKELGHVAKCFDRHVGTHFRHRQWHRRGICKANFQWFVFAFCS